MGEWAIDVTTNDVLQRLWASPAVARIAELLRQCPAPIRITHPSWIWDDGNRPPVGQRLRFQLGVTTIGRC